METILIGIVVFLFLLAIFDLSVGVSNDAVNFLNSAIGSRAARFRTVVIVAAVGVFIGAVMSNGMMDVARHGIFQPENFSLYDIVCICMAVMVTDIILLDIFNSLGMPTSTTVSLVFELLGATVAVSMFKLAQDTTGVGFGDLLNTEKAMQVMLGIFLSVAIAFVFGTIVQYLTRLWMKFDYQRGLKWKIGIFGGIAITAIVYFLLLKGAKDMAFMTDDVKAWIDANTTIILIGCLVVFTVLMQLLHWIGVNVFKVIVLTGTFALAMAFAGNDLVNFIGVPLTGYDAVQDYIANGSGDTTTFMMNSLNEPASTPVIFLVIAGVIMILALVTSRKARKVVETSVNLSRQDAGDEMFGSSRIARRLVRSVIKISQHIVNLTPMGVRRWLSKRMDTQGAVIADGAAFDLVRASVNLVLAGALIAFGTSLKLPLSTTFVTFMVAMGSSLADKAWGRESAVFRITGVISVIGGWFITAGAAFIGAGLIVTVMFLGGIPAMIIIAVLAIIILARNNMKKKGEEKKADTSLFRNIISTDDKKEAEKLLLVYLNDNRSRFLNYAGDMVKRVTENFFNDNASDLGKCVDDLAKQKNILKSERRRATLCFKHIEPVSAIGMSAPFHTANNCCMSMLYNMRRIAETCHEHIDNNFRLLPSEMIDEAREIVDSSVVLVRDTIECDSRECTRELRRRCDAVKELINTRCKELFSVINQGEPQRMAVLYVYLNMLLEMRELVSNLRKMLRAVESLRTKANEDSTAAEVLAQ